MYVKLEPVAPTATSTVGTRHR